MKKLIKKILVDKRRDAYRRRRGKKLRNKNVSIISRDCMGGVIYHDLGLQFLSPTINLYLEKGDFIKFVSHLFEYLAEEMTEVFEEGISFPVGQLTYQGEPIRIYFKHYASFEEAKAKWEERSARIRKEDIFILENLDNGVTKEDIEDFEGLPYENKLLIANANPTHSECVLVADMYNEAGYVSGKIIQYKNAFSVKRHLESIDYISILNDRK